MAIRRNSFVNLASNLVGLVLFAALTPLYFHVIGSERYGILAIIWVFLSFFSAFDFGMGAALTYRVAGESPGDVACQSDFFWTAMCISVPVGLVTGMILFGMVGGGLGSWFKMTPAISTELFHSAPALLGIGLCTVLSSTSGGLLRGREYFVTNAALNALVMALQILLPVLAALLISPSLYILIPATLAGRLIVVVATIVIVQTVVLAGARPSVSRRSARSLIGYGAWSSVAGVIELVISAADRVIIAAVAGPGAVGYYSVPSSVLARMMIFPTSLVTAALPQMTRRSKEEEAVLVAKIVRMIVMLTPCFVTGMFLARPFLRLWMGSDFAAIATVPMQWLLLAFWMEMIAAILFFRLLAQGRPKANAAIALVMVAPYCLLMYYMAGAWGVAGAAATYCCRNLFYVIGRAASTGSRRMLTAAIAPEGATLSASLAACLIALPCQPPVAVAAILIAGSFALAAKRRPPEFDKIILDLMARLRLVMGIIYSPRGHP